MESITDCPPELLRMVVPCLGLWEYTHTNEDGVLQYRVVGIAEDEEVASLWYEHGLAMRVLYVRETNSMDGV